MICLQWAPVEKQTSVEKWLIGKYAWRPKTIKQKAKSGKIENPGLLSLSLSLRLICTGWVCVCVCSSGHNSTCGTPEACTIQSIHEPTCVRDRRVPIVTLYLVVECDRTQVERSSNVHRFCVAPTFTARTLNGMPTHKYLWCLIDSDSCNHIT